MPLLLTIVGKIGMILALLLTENSDLEIEFLQIFLSMTKVINIPLRLKN